MSPSRRAAFGTMSALFSVALLTTSCSTGSSAAPGNPSVLSVATKPDNGEAIRKLPALATTKARSTSSFSGGTFTIHRLVRGSDSTLVVWSVTHERTSAAGTDFDVRRWQSFPVITVGGASYSVLTYTDPSKHERCVCIEMAQIRPDPLPLGALYPPIPVAATSVMLTSPWFEDVEVAVTGSAPPAPSSKP